MVWILPTMSRPRQCAEVLKRIRDSGCTSQGIVFINGNEHRDEYYDALRYPNEADKFLPKGWAIGGSINNLGCIAALNLIFKAAPDEPWYGFIADDEMLEADAPRDWDQRLIKAAGDWRIAHGFEDWNMGRRCQGYPVLGGKLVRAVGYLALPTCRHNFGFDSHWEWLNGPPAFGGGGLHNLVCIPEIKIQHNRANPDLKTDTCYDLGASSMEDDRKRFWDFCMHDLKPAAERVRNAMTV